MKQFDKDKDKRLNREERQAAREFVQKEREEGRLRGPGPGGRRGPGGGERREPPQAGEKISPADVTSFEGKDLYDPAIVRTIFLNFESPDWEKEMADFNNSDVEVPAELIVDGKKYKEVGVHFRGASSFFTVPEGFKRSLNVSLDAVHENQTVNGYKTLNLLNSHEDPSFLRTILYLQIAREHIPAPRANFVRVVINGENWGVYVNAEQFNKEFVKKNFGTADGARFKTPGSPRGAASLAYLGENADEYKRAYEVKSKDEKKAWADLIKLTKVLNQTPPEKLVAELSPLLDIDGALKYLAIEIALINNDGYWIRTSDYSLAQDEKGRFHVIPHDANETLTLPGGPGFGRGGGGGGGGGSSVELDPLVGIDDANKPLISKLLAVPELKAKYLGYVREIAEKNLDWGYLGSIAEKQHKLVADYLKADTRKLSSFEEFQTNLTSSLEGRGFGPGGGRKIGLKEFAEKRRAFLLNHPQVSAAKTAAR